MAEPSVATIMNDYLTFDDEDEEEEVDDSVVEEVSFPTYDLATVKQQQRVHVAARKCEQGALAGLGPRLVVQR